jgi:hypothetical protein
MGNNLNLALMNDEINKRFYIYIDKEKDVNLISDHNSLTSSFIVIKSFGARMEANTFSFYYLSTNKDREGILIKKIKEENLDLINKLAATIWFANDDYKLNHLTIGTVIYYHNLDTMKAIAIEYCTKIQILIAIRENSNLLDIFFTPEKIEKFLENNDTWTRQS